jgi:hypothetical protein
MTGTSTALTDRRQVGHVFESARSRPPATTA